MAGHLVAWLLLVGCLWPVAMDLQCYLGDSNATLALDRRTGAARLEQRFAFATRSAALAPGEIVALRIDHRADGEAIRYAPMLVLSDGRQLQLGPDRLDRAPFDRAVAAVMGPNQVA